MSVTGSGSVSGRTLCTDERQELEMLRSLVGNLNLDLGNNDQVKRGSFWLEDFGVPPTT